MRRGAERAFQNGKSAGNPRLEIMSTFLPRWVWLPTRKLHPQMILPSAYFQVLTGNRQAPLVVVCNS